MNAIGVPVVLTIAGSDSGGGAGIQADLKTFSALNVFGTCAITCVTAQNPDEITGIEPVDANMVSLQIKTVCKGFHVAAAKTGMLYSASIIRAVSKTVAECSIERLIVDPVMISSSGTRLLQEDALEALCSDLLPKATVITPNLQEAETICGHGIGSIDEMKEWARELGEKFGTACVIKGGHLSDGQWSMVDGQRTVTDVLYHEGEIKEFSSPRVDAANAHGTGCMFSAALTAFIARGEDLNEAVRSAKDFVSRYLNSPSCKSC